MGSVVIVAENLILLKSVFCNFSVSVVKVNVIYPILNNNNKTILPSIVNPFSSLDIELIKQHCPKVIPVFVFSTVLS